MLKLLGSSKYVPGRKFGSNYVKDMIDKCPSRKYMVDKKVEARIKGRQSEQAYSFLSSVAQIMDDVELSLTDCVEAKEVGNPTTSLEKRDMISKAEENRVLREMEKQIMTMMDDDARRTCVPELDEPEPSETKESDDMIASNLGYSRFMIEDVRQIGTNRIVKKNVGEKRQRANTRLERNRRVNLALSEEMQKQSANQRHVAKHAKEISMPPWRARLLNQYPEYYK